MSEDISKIINELNKKNFNKALKLCQDYPQNIELHILNNLKGIIYINLKKPDKAIEHFEKSLKIKQDYSEAYSNLANLYFSFRDYKKSIEIIKKALIYD